MNKLRSETKLNVGRRVSLRPDQIAYLIRRIDGAIARSRDELEIEFLQDILDRLVRARFNAPNGT